MASKNIFNVEIFACLHHTKHSPGLCLDVYKYKTPLKHFWSNLNSTCWFSPSWGQNCGSASGMSCPAWCWQTMLAISCRHCCEPARWRADSASLPMISHLGTKSLLGAWCAPSTLPGSPGMAAAGNLAPSVPPRISLKFRLLDGSWGTTPSNPVIPRSWGAFNLLLGFPPLRLVALLSALAAVPPVLSNLELHLPWFLFCFSQSTSSLFGSWLLWSGSLDRLVFLWGDTERGTKRNRERESEGGRERGCKIKRHFKSCLFSFWANTTETMQWFTIMTKWQTKASTQTTVEKAPEGNTY